MTWPSAALAQTAGETATKSYNIPPQALSAALGDFGQQSGLQVSVAADVVRDLRSPGVSGTLTVEQALRALLVGTGLTWRIDGFVVMLENAPRVADSAGDRQLIVTEALKVEGTAASRETGAERDVRRHDDVYDLDVSSTYAGKEEVERYKGTNTADVLKGMVNVFSGDARNGGALDPSVRGIQGPGRVPVIIDGTEQALTVWRGYNGASNRSYIDPSLISGLQVLKGPVSIRGVNGSTGGAVVVNTLDASDILKPGQKFGIELHLEGGNNSTNPHLPTLLTGQDYRTIPNFVCPGVGPSPTYPYCDPSLRVTLRTKDDNEAFSFGDRAIRLAAAGRVGDIELFGAYAFRERGNYFSGETAPGYYQLADGDLSPATYVRKLGLNYEPGNEVPNTSSKLESFLFKAAWHITDDQALQIGFRDSRSTFGDILPSRIITSGGGYFGNVQWPLSKVHAQAWNAEYRLQPGSRWLDFKATAWATDTYSSTYSSGGFPNAASVQDPIIVNTAISNSDNVRFGATASNQFNLSSKLSVLLEGNWQHEKLRSDDPYSTAAANGWRQLPRAGRREDYRVNLSAEWRPVSFLKLNGGLSYAGYWARDDFLPKLIDANGGSISQVVAASWRTQYIVEQTGTAAYESYLREVLYVRLPPAGQNIIIPPLVAAYARNPTPFRRTYDGAAWVPDAEGDYHRADNPCLNGSLRGVSGLVSCVARPNFVTVNTTKATRKSGNGWAPTLSATAYISGSSRAYARYAEAYRFPSMFESTIGFSASINPLKALKPEHIYSWEAAWVQDLRSLFKLNAADQHADLKLTYFHNVTHDVIERDTSLMFSNIDRQVIAGLELQARFDNGRFFTDLSASHMTTNKVCDESVATVMDPARGRVPDCVKYGFLTGFLLTQATPEDAVNWTVGGRFFNKRLEVGGRMAWYAGYNNPQVDGFTNPVDCVGGCYLNIPYKWGEIVTVDAYARFRINDRFSAELTGLNLNNRYYLDPLSRSMLPAPGRTVRLSLTGRF